MYFFISETFNFDSNITQRTSLKNIRSMRPTSDHFTLHSGGGLSWAQFAFIHAVNLLCNQWSETVMETQSGDMATAELSEAGLTANTSCWFSTTVWFSVI